MSKKDTQNTSLTAIESALQEQFKGKISPEKAAESFYIVAQKKTDWLVEAMFFGLCADAAKAAMPHGQFWKWLENAFKENPPQDKSRMHSRFEGKNPLETARLYVYMARKMKRQIAAPRDDSTFGKRVIEWMKEENVSESQVPMLFNDTKSIVRLITRFVDGMSLSSLKTALADASAEADADEKAEKLTAKNGSLKGLKGEAAAPQDPQMMLWEDWTNEFENIEKLIRHNQAARLAPEKWLAIENTLEAQLEEIRKITAGFKAGLAKKRK